MSLADCLKKLKLPDEMAAEITTLGVDKYQAGLIEDLDSLRAQLTEQGFDVPAPEVPARPTTRELFQSFESPELVARHNLSARNLIHADKMGGIAVPSLAINKASEPFGSFGDITLLGNKGLVDPKASKKNQVFAADIYSPRYPTVRYNLNNKSFNHAIKVVNEAIGQDGGYFSGDVYGLANNIEGQGIPAILGSHAVQYAYLKETGAAPKIPYRKRKKTLVQEFAGFKKFANKDAHDLKTSPEFQDAALAYIKEKYASDDHYKLFMEEDGSVNGNILREYARNVSNDRGGREKQIDGFRLTTSIMKKIDKADGFEAWVKDLFHGAIADERIFDGFTPSGNRRYLPHNMQTVVRILTKKVQDGEGFNYGLPSVRSTVAKKFKSIQDIKNNDDLLVSDEKFEEVKKEYENDFSSLMDELQQYSSYDGYGFGDVFSEHLKEIAERGNVKATLDEYYSNVPDDVVIKVGDFMKKLESMPTEYFEAKIQRNVEISEFSGAIMPAGKEYNEAAAVLKKHGVKVRRFKNNDAESKQGAIEKFSDTFFQQNRASIQFAPSGIKINLGMGSDRSSFLHESGHLFLEQLRQDQQDFGVQSPELVDDWNTVNKWWAKNADSLKQEAINQASKANDTDAVTELAAMSAKKVKDFVVTGNLERSQDAQGYLSIAMHEQWARGVEDYFRTGQAPSVALQDAFNRFRAWMVSIYKKATGKGGLDIQFSPDVKAVMDRLLATDDEINIMASQYDMKAMFGSAEEIGMTPGQFKNYQREVARSVEEGKTRQLKKHINEIERERQQWWKDEREGIKTQIEKEVHERKEYKLMYALANGTHPDGTPLESRRNRMDRKAIDLIMENNDSAKRLPRVQGKTLYATASKEGSAHPDIIASSYGYPGSREMLKELMNVPPMKDIINSEADAEMKKRHGDITIPEQAEAEAIESIHGDKRGDVLVAEVNALREGQEKMKSSFVRQWAKEQIGKQKVDNIKPSKFLAAEKRYSKLAAKEFKAGNMLEAHRAKFRQMMNHYMAKESYKVRAEMEKSRNYMRKFNKKKAMFKSLDADYVDRIKEILGSYQLGPRLSDKKRRQISSDAFVKWMEEQAENDGAIFNVPQEILDADEKTHYRDLTLDEFRTLTDSIKNIEAQGRLKKKALIAGELVDIQQMETDIMARLDNLPVKAVEAAKAIRQDPSFKDKATERFHSFDASLRKVEFLLEFMDGEASGPAQKAFFQPVADAEAQKNDMVRAINQVFMDKLAALPKDIRKRLGRDEFIPSLGREMNRGNLIMLALNIGNDSNLDKTIRGSEQEGAAWTEENITEALDVLTKEEWDFVQAVWDSFDDIYPQVQEIYRRENGVSPEKIEPKKIETKHGDYTGRYFPMMYDPRRSAMSRDLEGKSALEAMQSQTVKAGVFSGMTKARTNFAAPVLLDIAAVPNHVRRMAHYVSHYETVRLTRKLLSRKTLSTAITEKLGENYYRELKAWVGDVAADGQTDKVLNFWDKAVAAIRTPPELPSSLVGPSLSTPWLAKRTGLIPRKKAA